MNGERILFLRMNNECLLATEVISGLRPDNGRSRAECVDVDIQNTK